MDQGPPELTGTSYVILALVEQLGSATSYELKRAMEQATQSIWHVSHTTAYDEPGRLAERGYMEEQCERGGRRRRRYSLTVRGLDALRSWVEEPSALPPQLRDEALLKLSLGSEPAPIVQTRRTWHARKLKELERELARRGMGHWVARSEQMLLAAAIYHRRMLDLLDELDRRLRREKDGPMPSSN